jgi:carboxyl-terminal processing protease
MSSQSRQPRELCRDISDHPSSIRPGRSRPPRRARWQALRIALTSGLLLACCTLLSASALGADTKQSPYQNLAVFARALSHIELSYVGDVDPKKLVYGAIRGMVRSLDPHSDYLDPEEYRVLMSDTRGRFGGVGVEIDVRDGWLTVSSVFPKSPAARAGIQPGDRFVTIDGRRARDLPIEEAVRRMRGEPGTVVRVTLRRQDDAPAIEATLRREIIEVDAVEGRLLEDGFMYVRLRVFQETVARELRDVLDEGER